MAYTRVNWQNSPSHATPLSAENLNVMDAGIAGLDAAVTEAEGDISSLETTVEGHTTSIGTLANLTTTEKSNLVGAINEVNADVSDLKEDFENILSKTFEQSEIIQGSYDSHGAVTTSSARIRTSGFTLVKAGSKIKFTPGTVCKQIFYGTFTTSYVYIRDWGWYSGEYSVNVESDTNFIFVFKKDDGSDIAPSEYDATLEIITPLGLEMDELSESVTGKVDKAGVSQVTALNTDFLNVAKNLFDVSNAYAGYFTNYSSGQASNDGYRCYAIHVYPRYKYFSTGALQQAFTYFGAIGGAVTARAKIETFPNVSYGSGFAKLNGWTPTEEGYLYVTTGKADSSSTMVINSINPVPKSYFAYDDPLALEVEGKTLSLFPKTITVEKDGSGDFTTIKEALEYAIKGDGVKVYVGKGTYDLVEEFGSDYFAGISESGRWGLKLGGRMHIVFASDSLVTCHYTGNNDYVKQYFSPFNCADNTTGFTLENLTLECFNVRYGIHDEVNSQIIPYKNIYRNVSISIDNSENTAWTSRQCIGGGLGTSGEVVIENSYFESVGSDSADIVSYHNSGASTGRSNIVITGSYFANADSCRCSYYGTSTETSRMIVSNCSMGREPRKIAEASATVDNFELIAWNNEVRS